MTDSELHAFLHHRFNIDITRTQYHVRLFDVRTTVVGVGHPLKAVLEMHRLESRGIFSQKPDGIRSGLLDPKHIHLTVCKSRVHSLSLIHISEPTRQAE